MELDYVYELDDAGEVFFLIRLGGEVLDGDGNGGVWVFLQCLLSVIPDRILGWSHKWNHAPD